MTQSRPPGRKRAVRPRKIRADDATLTKLGAAGEVMFSEVEAAGFLERSPEDLARLLEESPKARIAFQAGRLRSLEALRRAQFKHAQTNASMAMFLGRTYLGQGERREGIDGEAAFDVSGAARRLRDKLAAIAADEEASEGGQEA